MKKRILSVALALTMAVSLAACGSKSSASAGTKVTITADELSEKVSEAYKNVKSVDIDADLAFDMGMSYGGETASVKADASGEASIVVGTPAVHAKGEYSFSVKGGGEDTSDSNKGEMYVVTDDTSATAYGSVDGGDWYKGETTLEEFMSSFDDILSEYGVDADDIEEGNTEDIPAELKPSITGKTVEAEGKECYEMVVSVDKSALDSIPGMSEYAAQLAMFGELKVEVKMYVDVKTNLPVKISLTADVSADDSASGMTLKLDKCDFTITAEYDKTDKIEVPSDVKDNAIESDDTDLSL